MYVGLTFSRMKVYRDSAAGFENILEKPLKRGDNW